MKLFTVESALCLLALSTASGGIANAANPNYNYNSNPSPNPDYNPNYNSTPNYSSNPGYSNPNYSAPNYGSASTQSQISSHSSNSSHPAKSGHPTNSSHAANSSHTTTSSNRSAARPQNTRYAGQVALAPAGLVLPLTLSTGISTSVAHEGDAIQATLSKDMPLGVATIPFGSRIFGVITNAEASGRLGHSGHLGIKFTQLQTPDGAVYPISAHLIGGLDSYHANGAEGSDQFRGDNGMTKLKAAGVRGAAGAGAGAVLGTAVGAIAGGGHGAGRGAWSGTALGAGLGVADSVLLRKGREINLKSGTPMQLQLDAPVSIAASGRNYM